MTDPTEQPAELVPESGEARETVISRGTRASVGTLAPIVRRAVRILRFPAYAVGLVPVLPVLGIFALAVTGDGWWERIVLVLLAAAGAAVMVLWWIRIHRYVTAVDDPDALTGEFVQLVDLLEMRDEMLNRLKALAEKGGIRFFRRLRSLWQVVTIPDYLTGRIEDLSRARWFVPPMIGTTVLRATALFWTAIVSWGLVLILLGLRLTGGF
ncbi:hypothetical protein IM660_12895 [Ruania alkalisoli]|uniref:Uncharacterized protein n=1 Tax=Ruania alkalisoli TaxID=2779775 RepID=A0A7M1SSJ8_9MICO|nr:hypothetical protein [Ruania alkalisoli]QOR69573.1 hypothetical protein IM660_12895 [Ruania alkalisoli]